MSSRDGRDGADGLVSNAQERSTHSETQADNRSVLSRREAKLVKYRQQRDDLTAELKTLNHRRKKVLGKLRDTGNAIYDLLHESGEVPSVTDHAVVRYLERVKGLDILELKAEVANHKLAHREGNVVVTVNPEADHD